MKLVKPTKGEMTLLIMIYFATAIVSGIVFGVSQLLIGWSVSIFIVLWCGYWMIILIRDMYYFTSALVEIMEENFNDMMKDKK